MVHEMCVGPICNSASEPPLELTRDSDPGPFRERAPGSEGVLGFRHSSLSMIYGFMNISYIRHAQLVFIMSIRIWTAYCVDLYIYACMVKYSSNI